MITKKEIEMLQSIVNNKAFMVGQKNNNQTRKELDEAIENLIVAEKEYNQQRKTKEVEYTISVRPIGIYEGIVTVYEDATQDEIKKAIFDDCEYYLSFSE